MKAIEIASRMKSESNIKLAIRAFALWAFWLGWAGLFGMPESFQNRVSAQEPKLVDCFSIKADLKVPTLKDRNKIRPSELAGSRFKETIEEYAKSEVYHVTYLPKDWKRNADKKLPIIFEFPGNGPYQNKWGDRCSGKVEDCKLGYGISGGKKFIWVCLPFLTGDGKHNTRKWWGDAPKYDVEPTVDYCRKAVPWICQKWGGDPDRVFLAGFSRGAIACNYVGLHDDKIAKLWSGMILFSHYDGVIETWPYPSDDRESARVRLERLACPQFICAEGKQASRATQAYLKSVSAEGKFTFRSIGTTIEQDGEKRKVVFRNHNDAWVLRPSDTRRQLRIWLDNLLD